MEDFTYQFFSKHLSFSRVEEKTPATHSSWTIYRLLRMRHNRIEYNKQNRSYLSEKEDFERFLFISV